MTRTNRILRPGHIDPQHIEDRHILFDCDGVLLDYVKAFGDFCRKQGYHPNGDSPLEYNMAKWVGVDNETLYELIRQFNELDEDFARIPAFEHARDGLAKLREMDFDITVITSATTTESRQKMRIENLDFHFGSDLFRDVIFLGVGQGKKDILKEFSPSLWVEDAYKNAHDGLEAGHLPVMLINRYTEDDFRNKSNDGISWVNGIHEIAECAEKAQREHTRKAA